MFQCPAIPQKLVIMTGNNFKRSFESIITTLEKEKLLREKLNELANRLKVSVSCANTCFASGEIEDAEKGVDLSNNIAKLLSNKLLEAPLWMRSNVRAVLEEKLHFVYFDFFSCKFTLLYFTTVCS